MHILFSKGNGRCKENEEMFLEVIFILRFVNFKGGFSSEVLIFSLPFLEASGTGQVVSLSCSKATLSSVVSLMSFSAAIPSLVCHCRGKSGKNFLLKVINYIIMRDIFSTEFCTRPFY